MTPRDEHRDDLTPDEIAELGALLVAERPQPSAAFTAELDARVASRFARPAAPREHDQGRTRGSGAAAGWLARLRLSLLPAAAATLAVALIALVVVLSTGGSTPSGTSDSGTSAPAVGAFGSGQTGGTVEQDGNATPLPEAASGVAADQAAPATPAAPDRTAARKIERSATLELGTPADHVDDVAQGVLGVVARYDGIVDQSSIASGSGGGSAQFALRIPATKLQPALAALSRLPAAHVLQRTDDATDVNQAYVSVRRQLANAQAERAGVMRALRAADTEDETLRLRARLDALERTIARAERAQRALDRRVDYSQVAVSVRADEGPSGGASTGGDSFTVGSAFHDALRVLEVAAGVIVIAAAALLPLALLLAIAWPLTRALGRRRREQALDAAA